MRSGRPGWDRTPSSPCWTNGTPDLLTMILGVFKTGGAYLPLDPRYPMSRLAQVLALSRAPVVVTSARSVDRMAQALPEMSAAGRPRPSPVVGSGVGWHRDRTKIFRRAGDCGTSPTSSIPPARQGCRRGRWSRRAACSTTWRANIPPCRSMRTMSSRKRRRNVSIFPSGNS